MTLKHRVHLFQKALLETAQNLLGEDDHTPSQLAAIGVLTGLAMVINAAEDAGAFDEYDVSEMREDAPAEG